MLINNDDKLNEHVAYTLLWLRAKRTRNGFKSSSLQEMDRTKRTHMYGRVTHVRTIIISQRMCDSFSRETVKLILFRHIFNFFFYLIFILLL